MVKFEFTLPDDQAELLIDILREYTINTETKDFNQHHKDWVEQHIKLVKSMADTISKSTRRIEGEKC